MRRPSGWLPWAGVRGIRARSTLAGTVVVAVALAVGAALLLFLLQRSLTGSVENAARSRADQVAREVAKDGVDGLTSSLAETGSVGEPVQVLDHAGTIVAASLKRAATRPFSTKAPPPGSTATVGPLFLPGLEVEDKYLVVTRSVLHRGERYTVVAAAPISAQLETVGTLRSLLLTGLPVLVLAVAAATYVLVGSALRPVEAIRRRVDAISARDLQARVPVPASGDEVARLAETMNRMLERLARAHHAQQRFIADASHELRSPLATLTTSLEVAAADPSGVTFRDLHPAMAEEAERMRHLVEDLLVLAKADEGGLTLKRGEVDLDDILAHEAGRLRAQGLDVQLSASPTRITGDRAKLAQVFRNLCDNAARYASRTVALSLSLDGSVVTVTVDDDGPGIPPESRSQVFERFTRLSEGRERVAGGSGLGLAIAWEIVRLHEGELTAGSAPLGGARLRVSLPDPG